MFVCALPSTGKSTLTSKYPKRFADSDGILALLTGDISQTGHDRMFSDPKLLARAYQIIRGLTDDGVTIVSNWVHPRVVVDFYVGYRPDDYIKHIKSSGRTDLLAGFGEDVLRGWAEVFTQSFDDQVVLGPSEYLEDAFRKKGLL